MESGNHRDAKVGQEWCPAQEVACRDIGQKDVKPVIKSVRLVGKQDNSHSSQRY